MIGGLRARLSRDSPRGERWQELLLVAVGIVVVVAMVWVAERGREDSERHLRAVALVEQVRASGEELSAISSGALAESFAKGSSNVSVGSIVARGVGAFSALESALTELRARENGAVAQTLRRDTDRLYAAGMQTLGIARAGNLRAAVQNEERRFGPAVERLNLDSQRAARTERAVADRAAANAVAAFVGSLAIGLAVLLLLGWRLHRLRREATLEADRRAIEARSEERLRALLEHSTDVVTVIGADRLVRWAAGSIRRMLGYEPGSLLGNPLTTIVHPDEKELVERFISAEQLNATPTISARFRHADGHWRYVEAIAENRLEDPAVQGLVLNMRDVTDRKALEDELRYRAFHDPLTGLANRALFEDRLSHALAGAERHGFSVGVVFLDMDDFKAINDGLGHSRGDELLCAVAGRIAAIIRPTDTAARLGGDEFAVIVEVLEDDEEAQVVAHRVIDALARPFVVAGREVRISASVGVAVCRGSIPAEDALRDADLAMYAAKERGKATVRVFEPGMRRAAVDRLQLSSELRHAVQRREFELDYQPIVALDSGRMIGVEALVRWHHPVRARLAPANFIALAEETGLIVPLGLWVLEAACTNAREWHRAFPSRPPLQLSVNVSTRQLQEPDFARAVDDVITASGIRPETVTLEITETFLLEDFGAVIAQLEGLKALGLRLAVDDFGTGYSALSLLRQFPIDILKIDRSFLVGIERDAEKAKLVRGMANFGESMLLEVVAEGIESPAQAEEVRAMHLPFGQGFLFSPPVSSEDLCRMVAAEVVQPVAG